MALKEKEKKAAAARTADGAAAAVVVDQLAAKQEVKGLFDLFSFCSLAPPACGCEDGASVVCH